MRDAEKPVGRIARNGNGLPRIAGCVHWFALYEGPQTLFVDDAGIAFSLPQGTNAAVRWTQERTRWWVGNYAIPLTRRGHCPDLRRDEIVSDLRVRLGELARRAA